MVRNNIHNRLSNVITTGGEMARSVRGLIVIGQMVLIPQDALYFYDCKHETLRNEKEKKRKKNKKKIKKEKNV